MFHLCQRTGRESGQINKLFTYVRTEVKEIQKNPGVRRRKEIIKIRAEINEKETGDYSQNQQK